MFSLGIMAYIFNTSICEIELVGYYEFKTTLAYIDNSRITGNTE